MKDLLEGNHHVKLLHPVEMVRLDLPAVNICGNSRSVSQREILLKSVDGARITAMETSVLAWSLTSENISIQQYPQFILQGEGPLHTGICSSFELQIFNLWERNL